MFKIDYEKLVREVYGESVDDLDYHFPTLHDMGVEVGEVEKKKFVEFAQQIQHDSSNLNERELEEATASAMELRYRQSYIDDIVDRVKTEMIERIINDFTDLNESILYDDIQFDLYNDNVTVDEQLNMLKENFTIEYLKDSDCFVFSGSIKKLALGIISVLHGHGMFRFTSIHEFNDQSEGEELDEIKLQKTIVSHLFWLKKYNSIYGTGNFTFDLHDYINHIERYYMLGDFDFSLNEVEQVLNF